MTLLSLSTSNNSTAFLKKYSEHFKFFPTRESVIPTDTKGYLYIFTASCYNTDISVTFQEETFKFGMTVKNMNERLSTYNNKTGITNIECIHCTLPEEKESLLKAFLSLKTELLPVAGNEYYRGCKNLIKLIMLTLNSFLDDEIVLYNAFFNAITNNKKKPQFNAFLSKVETILRKISNNKTFKLVIIEPPLIKVDETKPYVCEYCKTIVTSVYTLEKHKKTAGYCIEIQRKQFNLKPVVNTYDCEYCGAEFTTKGNRDGHLGYCKAKIEYEKEQNTKALHDELESAKKLLEEKINIIAGLNELVLKKDKEIEFITNELNEQKELYKNMQIKSKTYNEIFTDKFKEILMSEDSVIKNKINSIQPELIITETNENVELKYCEIFANKLSDMVILVDNSRGIIMIKKEGNVQEKLKAQVFVSNCLNISKKECENLLNNIDNCLMNATFNKPKHNKSFETLREYFTSDTKDKLIGKITKELLKISPCVSRFTVKNK